MTLKVESGSTLREFISSLGEDTLYAFDRRAVGVAVNGKKLWDSAKVNTGDTVVIFPIIFGG